VSDTEEFPIQYVVIIVICVVVATLLSLARGETLMQNEAVLKGHAEWVADTSGKPQFKWRECK
jgi:hypothetical protein